MAVQSGAGDTGCVWVTLRALAGRLSAACARLAPRRPAAIVPLADREGAHCAAPPISGPPVSWWCTGRRWVGSHSPLRRVSPAGPSPHGSHGCRRGNTEPALVGLSADHGARFCRGGSLGPPCVEVGRHLREVVRHGELARPGVDPPRDPHNSARWHWGSGGERGGGRREESAAACGAGGALPLKLYS